MEATGCATAGAICTCATAQNPRERPQVRPTASRTCGTTTKTQKQNHTQIPCACKSPLEKTMEADISIWQKPGHFYFALTRTGGAYCIARRSGHFFRARLALGSSIKAVDRASGAVNGARNLSRAPHIWKM